MRTRASLHAVLLAAVYILAAGIRGAEACSCAGSETPCQAFASSPIVFIGDVLSTEETGGQFHMRMRIVRAVKGITGTSADLWSDARTSCGVRLKEGERYVIHTSDASGRMSIGACHYIERITAGSPEPELPPAPGRVYGRVVRYDIERIRRFQPMDPIASVRVSLDLPAGRVTAVSDQWGLFTFAGVPPGKHPLAVDAGQGLTPWGPAPIVDVARRDSCASTQIVLQPAGRISGRVVTAEGRPAPHIYLRLFPDAGPGSPVSELNLGWSTDADGGFTFTALTPDSYTLAINPEGNASAAQPYRGVWFGGADRASAARIPVAEGAAVELDRPFVLPAPLPTRTFTIAVTCRDGSVPPGLMVQAVAGGGARFFESDDTGDGPVRTLKALRDQDYTLRVSMFIPDRARRGERREEKLAPLDLPPGAPGRHIAIVAPFTDCAESPR